ncbi:MAG: SIS domain-containing protein, partial [Nanoarchaeota archaeon]
MCGIFGYTGPEQNASEFVCEGLSRLDYRGYDSWGYAGVADNKIHIVKQIGKMPEHPQIITCTTCIGHTRWATHGGVTLENTHPHLSADESIAIAHNGIIENHSELKERFGIVGMRSSTDSEIIAMLAGHFYHDSLEQAIADTVNHLKGTFAIAAVHKHSSEIVVAKKGSPLIIGITEDATLISSDIPALLKHTKKVMFLEDDQIAVLDGRDRRIRTFAEPQPIEPSVDVIEWDVTTAEKDGYDHFMKKEIMQQPECIEQTIKASAIDKNEHMKAKLDGLSIKRIIILACGTSWHAGLVGEFLIEGLAGIPVEVEYASEFRYRYPPLEKDTL